MKKYTRKSFSPTTLTLGHLSCPQNGIGRHHNSTAALAILIFSALACPAFGAQESSNTDWFKEAKYGVFVHWLWGVQNDSKRENTMGKPAVSMDEWTNGFDTEKFAEQMKEARAGYVVFTMQQGNRYLNSPNETYEKLTGFKRGEATPHRDLVEDLYQSLHKRSIPLMLYWTGDGPHKDLETNKVFGFHGANEAFVTKWTSVAAEFSQRYGEKIKGWWVDGAWQHSGFGYNEEKWKIMADGLRAGNPKSIIGFNTQLGCKGGSSGLVAPPGIETPQGDFCAGEVNHFQGYPESRWCGGLQWHELSFIGSNWGHPGCKYKLDDLADYASEVMTVGGVMTFDVCVFRDGSVDSEQIKLLSQLRPKVEELIAFKASLKPIPADNLACWRPGQLLRLEGKGDLSPHGQGKTAARYGVDGDPSTYAQASGVYPWTYEVVLKRTEPIDRVVVTFGKSFATHYQIMISADRKDWKVVAEKSDHDGSQVEHHFAAAPARYIRICGIKPDGPNQKGGQMSIAELEVYGAGTGTNRSKGAQ